MSKISYKRSEINPFDANLVDLTTVLESAGHAENPISIREAATLNSISQTQEYVQCQCKTKCMTNRCACRSEFWICNSKRYIDLSCENKNE